MKTCYNYGGFSYTINMCLELYGRTLQVDYFVNVVRDQFSKILEVY